MQGLGVYLAVNNGKSTFSLTYTYNIHKQVIPNRTLQTSGLPHPSPQIVIEDFALSRLSRRNQPFPIGGQ